MTENVRLHEIASVASGSAVNRGRQDARAVMVGHLDGSGNLPQALPVVGSPPGGIESQLRPGDIVMSLRGMTNYAAVVEPEDLVDAPLFATLDLAVIGVRDRQQVEPRYIATFLNLPSTQQQLGVHRSGTAALRLPLPALRELRTPIPSLERQHAIVALADASAAEQQLSRRIAQLRLNLLNELLRRAAAEGPAPGMVPTRASTGPNGPGTTERALSTPGRKVS
jgi:hypothetical protein